ncbi:MAG: alpha/beta hydrolase [Rhodocyclaceae bacterium]|nr:alpha/beta hydrolase [Rhodocyclaceae bacterium]
MKSQYAALDGIRLHYLEAGAGPPMLFVHGFPEFWYAWESQLAEFSKDHRAVALDMRGHNLSDKPADAKAYRPKHLVADLRGMIDHLGGKAIVVAHDWGGAAAWNLATAHPERIEKLVIINSPHPVAFARELRNSPAQQQASAYMNWLRRPGAAEKAAGGRLRAPGRHAAAEHQRSRLADAGTAGTLSRSVDAAGRDGRQPQLLPRIAAAPGRAGGASRHRA